VRDTERRRTVHDTQSLERTVEHRRGSWRRGGSLRGVASDGKRALAFRLGERGLRVVIDLLRGRGLVLRRGLGGRGLDAPKIVAVAVVRQASSIPLTTRKELAVDVVLMGTSK
jgi:hypothetical protein